MRAGEDVSDIGMHKKNAHRIVVWTEVFEMAEAGVADADEDSDTQDHQGEKRCGSQET